MADTKKLRDAFLDELRDAYDAEKQLIKALPKMARAASDEGLRAAFASHLVETRGHVGRLEGVFGSVDEKARGKHCDGMAGILDEGKSVMEDTFDAATKDAALIASAQRVEHYEMAAYGTMVAWARALGLAEAADALQLNLDEEGAADKKLSALAEGGINARASGSDGVVVEEQSAGAAIGGVLRRIAGALTLSSAAPTSRKAARGAAGRRTAKTAKKAAKKTGQAAKKRATSPTRTSATTAAKKAGKKTANNAAKKTATARRARPRAR